MRVDNTTLNSDQIKTDEKVDPNNCRFLTMKWNIDNSAYQTSAPRPPKHTIRSSSSNLPFPVTYRNSQSVDISSLPRDFELRCASPKIPTTSRAATGAQDITGSPARLRYSSEVYLGAAIIVEEMGSEE